MAQVESMTYKFNGSRAVNVSVDAEMLSSALKAQGVVNYDSNKTDTFEVKQPMYIGYTAYNLADLEVEVFEDSDEGKIKRAKIQPVQQVVFPLK